MVLLIYNTIVQRKTRTKTNIVKQCKRDIYHEQFLYKLKHNIEIPKKKIKYKNTILNIFVLKFFRLESEPKKVWLGYDGQSLSVRLDGSFPFEIQFQDVQKYSQNENLKGNGQKKKILYFSDLKINRC